MTGLGEVLGGNDLVNSNLAIEFKGVRPGVVGQQGVSAHAHYDGYHNFYVQLVGRKRFVVFPPEAWDDLGVYVGAPRGPFRKGSLNKGSLHEGCSTVGS